MLRIKILLTAMMAVFTALCSAQLSSVAAKSEDYIQFKASKTYYVQTGNEKFDSEMAAAKKEIWTITPTKSISVADFKMKIKDKTASFNVPILIGYDTQGYHYLALFNGGKKKIESYNYKDMLAYCPINFGGTKGS